MNNLDPVDQVLQDTSQASDTKTASMDAVDQILHDTQNNDQSSSQDISQATKQNGSQDYNGECQKFVEQMVYGHSGIFPSAVDAWNSYAKQGQAYQGTKGIKPGDLVYFAPDQSNQGYGHTGIYLGNGQFVSATDNGVMSQNMSQWQQQTGQQLLGYVPIQEGKN